MHYSAVLLPIFLVFSKCFATDYCDKKLCYTGHHIACNNTGKLSPDCPPEAKIIDLNKFKNDFTHAHNTYRNLIASGNLPGYEPAARMATMRWDKELAKLAELNVKTCQFNHDNCYHTERFRNAGQCLAGLYIAKNLKINMTHIIEESVGGWFKEHSVINMDYILHFRMDANYIFYGHFAELVVERNTHVGCAAIQFPDPAYPDWSKVHVACNYASVFSEEVPVYQPGLPASKCETGRNPKYTSLCSLKEKINPNYYNY